MAKPEAEWSNRLHISWLKKYGYLDKNSCFKSGGISWGNGSNPNKSSIGFRVIKDNAGTADEKAYMLFQYTSTSNRTGEKTDMNFRVDLTTTPCNYGWVRYWFICPLTTNGRVCGRRVGVLFSIDKWFGCRHCGNIAYASQMRGGMWRGSAMSAPELDELRDSIKRTFYNGKLTRKYRRYVKQSRKFMGLFSKVASILGERTKRAKSRRR